MQVRKVENKEPYFVSIVVITKNNMSTIQRCLDSLLGQDYPKRSYEIVFVDGHSKDGTDELIKEHVNHRPEVKLVYEDVGTMGYARNVGINASKGEIIAFTDGDAYPEREWLKKISRAFKDDPRLAVVGGRDIPTVDDWRAAVDQWRKLAKSYDLKATCKTRTVNFAVKHSVLDTVGGYDPLLSHFDEGELMARIYSLGPSYKEVYDPEITVLHEKRNFSIGARMKKKFRKSMMGVPVLFRKHVFRVAIRNLGSPFGTSLCFVLGCLAAPFLIFALLYFLGNIMLFLLLSLALGLTVIVAYLIRVRRTTGKFMPKLAILLVLDFFPLLIGTIAGLIKMPVDRISNRKNFRKRNEQPMND